MALSDLSGQTDVGADCHTHALERFHHPYTRAVKVGLASSLKACQRSAELALQEAYQEEGAPGGVLDGQTVVGSPIEVIELHLSMSMFRTDGKRVHNEWVPTVSPVVVDTENNAKARGPLQTGECRAEQMTNGTNAYPCRADSDSS